MTIDRVFTETERNKLLKTMTILVDTREKKGKNDHILNFFDAREIPWRRQKLDAGDYSMVLPMNEDFGIKEEICFADQVMIERKQNLNEISSNFTEKSKRIYRELERSPRCKVLLIENNTYCDLVNGNYDTKLEPKSFWALMLTIWHRYNIPVMFMPDKKYSGQFIYGYFYYYLRNLIKVK